MKCPSILGWMAKYPWIFGQVINVPLFAELGVIRFQGLSEPLGRTYVLAQLRPYTIFQLLFY